MSPKRDKKKESVRALVSDVTVLGPLDKAVVERVLRAKNKIMQRCGEAGLGTFTVRLHINAQGLVVSVKIMKQNGTTVVGRCLKHMLVRLRFTSEEKVSLVTATITLK